MHASQRSLPLWTAYDSTVLIDHVVAQHVLGGRRTRLSAPLRPTSSQVFVGIISTDSRSIPVVAWPSDLRVEVNAMRLHPVRHRLLEVTEHCDPHRARLDVECASTGDRDFAPRLILFVAYGFRITADDYCKTIRAVSPPQQLCRRFNKGVVAAWTGKGGASWAGRTTFCKHTECFDLRAEIARVSPLLHMGVSCPICGAHALMCNLYVDTFVQSQIERDCAFSNWRASARRSTAGSPPPQPEAPDQDPTGDLDFSTIWTMGDDEMDEENTSSCDQHSHRLRTPLLYTSCS